MRLTESANPSCFSRKHTVVLQSTAATGMVSVWSMLAIFSISSLRHSFVYCLCKTKMADGHIVNFAAHFSAVAYSCKSFL